MNPNEISEVAVRTHAINVRSRASSVRATARSVRSSASVVRSSASSFDDFGVPSGWPVIALAACGGAGCSRNSRPLSRPAENSRPAGRRNYGTAARRLREIPAPTRTSSTASRLRWRRPRASPFRRDVGSSRPRLEPGCRPSRRSCGPCRRAWAARTRGGTACGARRRRRRTRPRDPARTESR